MTFEMQHTNAEGITITVHWDAQQWNYAVYDDEGQVAKFHGESAWSDAERLANDLYGPFGPFIL